MTTVDRAFGLWALADPTRQHLVHGLTDADSWATDAHMWLNVTYDSGIVFLRRAEHLRRSFASVCDYLPPDNGFEAMHHTPQSSQRARQIEVWAALRCLGRAGLANLVATACRQARRISDALAGAGLEILNDVVLNQVLVSAGHDETTRRLIAAIQTDGTCWCGPTTWNGRVTADKQNVMDSVANDAMSDRGHRGRPQRVKGTLCFTEVKKIARC